jgi:hypothetical protein
MRPLRLLPLALLAVLLAAGCNPSGHIKARGRVVKGGQPFLAEKGQGLRIFFAPVELTTGGYDSYAAEYNPADGTFLVVGKDRTGLPPGKYRVGLQLMQNKEDLFNGKLLGKKSPFILEVARGGDDLVIDLDQAPLVPDKPAGKAGSKTGGKPGGNS